HQRRKVRREHAPRRLRGTDPRVGEKAMATTTELEARIKELEERLEEMEADRDRWGVRSLFDELFPSEARKHMRTARKEQLMAIRSVLDHWIAKQEGAKWAGRGELGVSVGEVPVGMWCVGYCDQDCYQRRERLLIADVC